MKIYDDFSVPVTEIAKDFVKAKDYTRDRHYNSALVHVREMERCLKFWEMYLLRKRDEQEEATIQEMGE
jgi:hypothetical protein